MSFFDSSKAQSAVDRLNEEQIYEAVLKESQQGIRREGLWAKAIAKSEGNDKKAKSLYIEYRVQSIIDEIEITEKLAIVIAKAEKEEKEQKEQRTEKAEKYRLEMEKEIHAKKMNNPEEIERIKRLKKAAKQAGAKYIPS